MPIAEPLFSVRDVRKRFGAVEALRGVSLDLHPGEVVALVGDNGAGKSTLVKVMAGTISPDAGEICFGGDDIRLHSPADAGRLGIAVVFQDLALCNNLDVVANLFLGHELERGWMLDEVLMESKSREFLAELSIRPRSLRTSVGSLSGGQRQSIAIARSLLGAPRVVILDEPTAALGVEETRMVAELIDELKSQGIGILLIDHDIHQVMNLCDRASVMKNGKLVGTVEIGDVTDDDLLAMIILGKNPKESAAETADA